MPLKIAFHEIYPLALDGAAEHHPRPAGDGRAAERTVAAIRYFFGYGSRPEDFGDGSLVELAG